MSQLWLVDGKWLNREQIRQRENPVVEEPQILEEERASQAVETPVSVDTGKFVEAELYELKNRELMELLKEKNIRTTGIPNKKTLIELLINS